MVTDYVSCLSFLVVNQLLNPWNDGDLVGARRSKNDPFLLQLFPSSFLFEESRCSIFSASLEWASGWRRCWRCSQGSFRRNMRVDVTSGTRYDFHGVYSKSKMRHTLLKLVNLTHQNQQNHWFLLVANITSKEANAAEKSNTQIERE